jgi:hypothetical protein
MNELTPWFGEPPHTTAPELPGYRQIAHEKLDIGRISIVGLLLIPVWALGITGLVAILGGRSEYSMPFSLVGFLLIFALLFVVILLHEVVHGIAAALLGARPSFGVGPGFAYTTFLEPMGKTRYLTVGLAPLVLMTAAAVGAALAWPSLAGWLIYAATINASGAIGDLWMAARIVRAPARAKFYDLADGFAVYEPDPDNPSA